MKSADQKIVSQFSGEEAVAYREIFQTKGRVLNLLLKDREARINLFEESAFF